MTSGLDPTESTETWITVVVLEEQGTRPNSLQFFQGSDLGRKRGGVAGDSGKDRKSDEGVVFTPEDVDIGD